MGLSGRMRAFARKEIERQWDASREAGLPCRFVSAHHHLHVHPWVRGVLVGILPKDFSGWVRWGRPRFFSPTPARVFYEVLDSLLQEPQRGRLPFRLSTTLWGIDRTFNMKADEILVEVGLGDRITHKPGELSGGEQQRVAVARSLILQPALILADEPTGNLDTKTGHAIHDLLMRLNTEKGVTLIVVTHNPAIASRIPRRIQMVDGKVFEEA